MRLLKQEICRYAKLAFTKGLISGGKATLSIRIENKKLALITAGGANFNNIMPHDIVLLDFDGKLIASSRDLIPPEETPFILNAYKRRRFIGAVGHFSPPYATAFSCKTAMIPLMTDNARQNLKEILLVKCNTCPHRFEGLCECVEGQRKSYAAVNNLLIQNDGIVTMGENLTEVFRLAELMEQNAKLAYIYLTTAKQRYS